MFLSSFHSVSLLFTIFLILSPPCILATRTILVNHGFHGTQRYVYFPDKPRWTRHMPMMLTYAFYTETWLCNLSLLSVKQVFERAFTRWANVIQVSFIESDDYEFADIRIGFYKGDHGDGEPFDGVLGVLAHSFSPESGRLHLDAAETWAVDFGLEKSAVAVDLESVATHEIGHLLGLAHSMVKEAVMYPRLKPREKRADLQADDVQGIQALYGSKTNTDSWSLLQSDTSTNQANDLSSRFEWVIPVLFFIMFHSLI